MKFKIYLDSKLYPIKYIKRAIEDYREVATINIEEKEDKLITCSMLCEKKEYKKIENEFKNYLIAIINGDMG